MSRRLDAERLALWREFRRAATRVEDELAELLEREHNIDVATYELLERLNDAGGRARMADLAAALVINRSTFTRLVDRLDAKGLVTRELTDDDGRGVVAVLTSRGRRTFVKARPAYRRALQDAFARHLTDTDLAALHRVFNKVDGETIT
jgi:DNA-binding MarR family transcriptional regulator